jgi:hypothetical protein
MPRSHIATDTSTELQVIIGRKEKSINFLAMSRWIKTMPSILKKYKESRHNISGSSSIE